MRRRSESPRHNGARHRNEVQTEDLKREKTVLVQARLETLAQAGQKTWIENAALLIADQSVLRLIDIVDRVVRLRNEMVAGLKGHVAWIAITASQIADQAIPRSMDIADRVVLPRDEMVVGLKDNDSLKQINSQMPNNAVG